MFQILRVSFSIFFICEYGLEFCEDLFCFVILRASIWSCEDQVLFVVCEDQVPQISCEDGLVFSDLRGLNSLEPPCEDEIILTQFSSFSYYSSFDLWASLPWLTS